MMRQHGFTLIETLLALTLLGFITTAAALVTTSAVRSLPTQTADRRELSALGLALDDIERTLHSIDQSTRSDRRIEIEDGSLAVFTPSHGWVKYEIRDDALYRTVDDRSRLLLGGVTSLGAAHNWERSTVSLALQRHGKEETQRVWRILP